MLKISLIVPVYNVEEYLRQCVDSLLSQTYENMEIILVDDGSTDNSPLICDEYILKDSRVKVIHQKNAGVSVARDNGVKASSGDYIGFVDSDDYILPNSIEKLMKVLNADNSIDMLIFEFKMFVGTNDNEFRESKCNMENDTSEKIKNELLMDRYLNYLWNKFYKRSIFENILVPPKMILEDLYLMPHILVKCKNIKYAPIYEYCYRLHHSYSRTRSKIKFKYGLFLAWREHERICEQYGYEALEYSRFRAQTAAVATKILNSTTKFLSKEQEVDLDNYLENMSSDSLETKYKMEYFVLMYLPTFVSKFISYCSIFGDAVKRMKSKY